MAVSLPLSSWLVFTRTTAHIFRWERMGKTNPIYRQLLDEWIDDWQHFRRGLRGDWSGAFNGLMGGAKQHADAATYSNPAGSAEIEAHAFMSICLQQQLRIKELEERVDHIESE